MNGPNTPPEKESPQKKKQGISLQSLMKKAVSAELSTHDKGVDPVKYDTINTSTIGSSIRAEMKRIRDMDGDESIDFSDDDIDGMKDSAILSEILIFAQPLKNARKNLKNYIRKRIPGITTAIPDFQSNFDKVTAYMDKNALSLFIGTGKKKLTQFISEKFGVDKDVLVYTHPKFRDILARTNLPQTSPLYKRLLLAGALFEKNGYPPDFSLIEEMLEYLGSDTLAKKEICTFFNLSISLKDAQEYTLVSPVFVEQIIADHCSPWWDTLGEKEKGKIKNLFSRDDNILIQMTDIDESLLEQQFRSGRMKKLLTSLVRDEFFLSEKERIDTGFTEDIKTIIDTNGNILMHAGFLEKIAKESRNRVKNIANFVPGSIIATQDKEGTIHYLRLDAINKPIGDADDYGTIGSHVGMEFSLLTGTREESVGTVKSTQIVSYEDFQQVLLSSSLAGARIFSSEEFQSKLSKNKNVLSDGKNPIIHEDAEIFDATGEEEIHTQDYLKAVFDEVDPEGRNIPLEVGMTFSAKSSPDEDGATHKSVWKIAKLNGNTISVQHVRSSDPSKIETASFKDFAEVVRSQEFHRIGNLETDEQLLSNLKKYGIGEHTSIKGSDLVTKVEEDDGHGHHKHVEKKIEFFQAKEGGHIRIGGIKDGFVYFGEFSSPTSLSDIQKRGSLNQLTEKEKKGIYTWQTVSYAEFVDYLAANKMQATTNNLLVQEADNKYKPQDAHLEGSLWSKLGKSWSIADIMKGFGNLTHAVEHHFEKSSKLNASRFALAMAEKLNLPLEVRAGLQSEEVGSVKEIIEKYVEKLRNLNGPMARNKALHIAHNKDARPEHVAAAILYMVKGYGHLYAEDIKYAQGSESFINGLLNACGFRTPESQTRIKKEAWQKARGALGDEANAQPTEEELIWAFMKLMDGEYEKYPVAGTLVKAMGGPSGYEAAWRKDGFDGAYEKGIRQAGDLVNAQARADHGLSALMTHEFHTAMGSMESAAGKAPGSSAVQVVSVVWALGGYSQYISSKASQKIKDLADSKGYSFHAFAFLRNHTENELYQKVFLKALTEIGSPDEVANTRKWIHDLQYHGHDKQESKSKLVKAAVNGLAGIWRKYCDKGLHDMLQGKNMWLMENANKDSDVDDYFERFSDMHLTASGKQIPGEAQGWNYEGGYITHPVMSRVEDKDGKKLRSLDRTLRKLDIDSHKFTFRDEDMRDRFWTPTVAMVQNLRATGRDKTIIRAQYLQYRKDILEHFSTSLSARGGDKGGLVALRKQKYYRDFAKMGIDIDVIFNDGNIDDIIESTAETDLQRWMDSTSHVGSETDTVRGVVNAIIDPTRKKKRLDGGSTSPNIHDPDMARNPGSSPGPVSGDSSGSD